VHSVRSRLLIAASVLLASAPIASVMAAAAVPAALPAANEPAAIVRVDADGDAHRAWRDDRDGGTVVDAPGAYVDTRGPVEVDAPAAHIEVNRGSVRVEAPFVNLRIPR